MHFNFQQMLMKNDNDMRSQQFPKFFLHLPCKVSEVTKWRDMWYLIRPCADYLQSSSHSCWCRYVMLSAIIWWRCDLKGSAVTTIDTITLRGRHRWLPRLEISQGPSTMARESHPVGWSYQLHTHVVQIQPAMAWRLHGSKQRWRSRAGRIIIPFPSKKSPPSYAASRRSDCGRNLASGVIGLPRILIFQWS